MAPYPDVRRGVDAGESMIERLTRFIGDTGGRTEREEWAEDDGPAYVEASVPVGALLIVLGVAALGLQFVRPVFVNWLWAVVIGGAWVALGTLLLFPDVRLYQYERSPVERLLEEGFE